MARRCRALARDRGRSLRHTEGDRSRSCAHGASGLPIEPLAAVHSLDAEIRVSKVRPAGWAPGGPAGEDNWESRPNVAHILAARRR